MKTRFIGKTVKADMFISLMGICSLAEADNMRADIDRWQNSLLFEPSAQQLQWERQGRVMIYDGLKDKTIDSIMDSQFERLGAMMFTSVVVTDEDGSAIIDPDTNEVLVEDDGC